MYYCWLAMPCTTCAIMIKHVHLGGELKCLTTLPGQQPKHGSCTVNWCTYGCACQNHSQDAGIVCRSQQVLFWYGHLHLSFHTSAALHARTALPAILYRGMLYLEGGQAGSTSRMPISCHMSCRTLVASEASERLERVKRERAGELPLLMQEAVTAQRALNSWLADYEEGELLQCHLVMEKFTSPHHRPSTDGADSVAVCWGPCCTPRSMSAAM